MLEGILSNPWVAAAAFIIGPAILFWLRWRQKQPAKGTARPTVDASRVAANPKPAPAAAGAPAPEKPVARNPLGPGYGGLKWGEPPTPGMQLVHEEGDTRFLALSSDDLVLGNVHLSSVAFSFRRDRLEAVVIDLPAGGFELLTRHLISEWGPPRTSADRTKHVWTDPGNGPEDSQAVLEKRVESRTARLVLSSRAALAERGRT